MTHLIGCWQNLGAVCFWQPISSGLNLVIAAVLRDSLCVVSLLPCVTDCYMLYTVRKVERFVLTIIKRRLLLLLLILTFLLHRYTLGLPTGQEAQLLHIRASAVITLFKVMQGYRFASLLITAHRDCLFGSEILLLTYLLFWRWARAML